MFESRVVTSKTAMKQAKVRFTYNDYLLLPEEKRYEILDGELYMVAAPNIKHQRVSRKLTIALTHHVEKSDLGEILYAPCDLLLSEENVVQPDILFVRKERSGIIGEANLKGAPDLVVEILSPATRCKDLELKRKTYARFGVQEYWIVDPDAETAEVLVWNDTGYVIAGTYLKSGFLSSALLPDLKLALAQVFA
jgi:Uma2 family endonuclease